MAQQFYIDENGNEVQVSGTVNSADMLPIEAGSSKMTKSAIDGITHPTKIWSGSKYTLNDYIDIPDFDKDTMYMFEFFAFSSTYHTCFLSPVGDGYLQFVVWGESTQHCRYRFQINTSTGRLTITDVINGGAGQALIAIYAVK